MKWLEKCEKYKMNNDYMSIYKDFNRTFGISIYPDKDDIEIIKKYIDLAAQYNIKWAFSNLLSDGTRKKEEIVKQFKDIIMYANSKGIKTMLDVSPSVYKMLGIKEDNTAFFKELGAAGIRLDEFFGGDVEAKLSNNKDGIIIEMNASDVRVPELLDLIKSKGGNLKNVMTCHNFYPQRYTGLSEELFDYLSIEIKKRNAKVKAFIHTNNDKSFGPWDIFEGLPTIEYCRNIDISSQARHYFNSYLVDELLISDCYATKSDFEELEKIDPNILNFKIDLSADVTKLEEEIILMFPHSVRKDISEYMMRSTWPRNYFATETIKPRDTKKELVVGDIVILNDKYGRYKGELHIITKNMINDGGKNFVGKISKYDIPSLSKIINILIQEKNSIPFNLIK